MSNDLLYFDLNTGARIPSVGLGTWQSPLGEVYKAVITAVKAGYRHIDCARNYDNEEEVGQALKKLFEDGVVKREDMFITSKLWSSDHAPEDVPVALDAALKDLQLDYIDLYLLNNAVKSLKIHWPMRTKKSTRGFNPETMAPLDIPGTWNAMEKLYDSGKARAIGVSNFSSKKLDDLLKIARVPPAVDQVECHPGWQQHRLREFCRSKGVHLSAYSPLGSPGTAWIKGDLLKKPNLNMIAEKLGKTTGQVALRWGLQMGQSVLPKSTNEARIRENLDVCDWSIPEDLFSKFSEIEQASTSLSLLFNAIFLLTTPILFRRLLTGNNLVHETNSPYKSIEEVWDDDGI
ncbi:aldo-keto reductase family 4 member C9 [Cinnamomum micranthum f. kanehirae]|uniref:Aldo-keto reductase family 4 member C9 n=1 Tax=Cinnamomum micranthum f. kanehirae TaxID=337451 RepID=A0A443PMN3_9MAGN|nr:aldo-keto reductase family 4 member C9 [Cinnamomum micranthum f. kanehirae]